MAQALVCSPQVKAGISHCAQMAQQSAGDARYVVYAILDPTQEDPFGIYPGLPIYVGETCRVRDRVMEHFQTACRKTAKEHGRMPHIRQLLQREVVTPVVVLQRLDTRIDTVEAEIRWSQAFLAKGYPLTNMSPGQRKAMSAEKIEQSIRIVQWDAPIYSTIKDGLRISASCDWCGRVSIFQPEEFLAYFSPKDPVRRIRQMASHCNTCGEPYEHAFARRDEEAVAFTPHNYLDWEH